MPQPCWVCSAGTPNFLAAVPCDRWLQGHLVGQIYHLVIGPTYHGLNDRHVVILTLSLLLIIGAPLADSTATRRALPSVRAPYLPSVSFKVHAGLTAMNQTRSMIISAVVHLLGVSVVSHLISRRVLVNGVQCSLRRTSWPRLCVLIVFLDSYLFLFTSGILILGVGMTTSAAACSLGIYLCIIFYGTSKFFIYLFLSKFFLPSWRCWL